MKAIIFGAGGQLGIDLMRECRRRGHSSLPLTRDQLNITDTSAVLETIERYKPEWVLNAAAYNKVDLAHSEPEAAMKVNALAVQGIAAACNAVGSIFVHYSTDHVFSGRKKTRYTEKDQPDPPSAYAISKLTGEMYVRVFHPRHYVLRVAGVFGPAGRYTNHGNFPELILRKAAQKQPLRIVDDFIATPTYSPAVARRTFDILEKRIPFGLYHLGGADEISWYDYALEILAAAKTKGEIGRSNHQEYKTIAARPRYAALSNAKLESVGIEPMPSLDECLRDFVEKRKRERPRRKRSR